MDLILWKKLTVFLLLMLSSAVLFIAYQYVTIKELRTEIKSQNAALLDWEAQGIQLQKRITLAESNLTAIEQNAQKREKRYKNTKLTSCSNATSWAHAQASDLIDAWTRPNN